MANLRVIDSDKIIHDLFNNLSKHEEIPVSIQFGDEKNFALLKFSEEQPLPYFETSEFSKAAPEKEESVEITFFYRETFINFQSVVTSIDKTYFCIALPKALTTSYNRTKTRYRVHKEDHVFVSVYGAENKYQVMDISTSGLSYEADRDSVEEGEIIRNMMLVLGGGQPVYLDGQVMNVSPLGEGYFRYGIKFLSLEWIYYQKIFTFIFEKSYPDIKMIKDISLEDISSLYDKSQYIRMKNASYGKDVLTNIAKLEKLKNHTRIAISLVQQREGRIKAIASAIRSFNQAFYVQQILSLPEEEMESLQKTDMYAGLTDSLLGHPYFEGFVMHISNETEWFLEMIRIMEEIINDRDKLFLDPQLSYTCHVHTQYNKNSMQVFAMKNPQDFVTFSHEAMSAIEARTYCYQEENFFESDLCDVYQSMGFFLSRKLYEVKRGDERVAYAVAEAVPEEVDLDGYLNTVRLYPVNADFDLKIVTEALLQEVNSFYQHYGIEKYALISKHLIQSDKIQQRDTIHRLFMSREGVVEFLYFIKANII